MSDAIVNKEIKANNQTLGNKFIEYFGFYLILMGIGAAVYFSLFYEISVGTDRVDFLGRTIVGEPIVNMGLMNNRIVGLIGAVGAALLGILFMFMAFLVRKKGN